MNKSNLNLLCQKNKWELPVYSDIIDVQNHDTPFRASVVVNGITFDSETMFKSKKMAYNDAAGVAFSYFTALSSMSSFLFFFGTIIVKGFFRNFFSCLFDGF